MPSDVAAWMDSELSSPPLDDGNLDWSSQFDWNKYVEARDKVAAYEREHNYQQDRDTDTVWWKMRWEEQYFLLAHMRANLEQISKRTVRAHQTSQIKGLKYQYGKASQTIHELRQQIKVLRLMFAEAEKECECGAWRKARYHTPIEELKRKNGRLSQSVSRLQQESDHYKAEIKRLKEQARGEADSGAVPATGASTTT